MPNNVDLIKYFFWNPFFSKVESLKKRKFGQKQSLSFNNLIGINGQFNWTNPEINWLTEKGRFSTKFPALLLTP